jgi:hypothetical protein
VSQMNSTPSCFRTLGPIPYSVRLRGSFREGTLAEEWVASYPQLFDALDLSQARNQAPSGHLFHEWFAAIALHVATGYRALVAKYQFRKHARKWETAQKLVGPSAWGAILERGTESRCHGPDLLMYAEDRSHWFFCEVKGPTDRIRSRQREYFESIAVITQRPIYVLSLREVSFAESLVAVER